MSTQHTHFETLAVHGGETGERPRPSTPPIYTATTFGYETTDGLDAAFTGAGPFYQRNGNPTTAAFERACAALERAEGAVAFGSGMAALHGALLGAGVKAGDTIVSGRDMYGVTVRLLNEVFAPAGVRTEYVDTTDLPAARDAISRLKPRAVLVEAISNPLLRLADIGTLAEAAHAAGSALIVDSTFATPYLVCPHELGADLVVHSATKYLGGHGDALGGVVTGSGEPLTGVRTANVVVGAVLAPFEASLLLRGLKTLSLRMERHCANAAAIAGWLETRTEVSRVYYPGLASHPQRELAGRLFGNRGFGGMVSFDLRDGGRRRVSRFIDSLKLAFPGPTLGDVETLVMYPALASHRALSAEQRAALGISDGLVRLSVGIEHAEDIIADIEQALARAGDPADG
ncbi:MAG TPA: PLP-dependent aspartate aminotransferase family protein [Armatimonadota bacterium]|jgi:cystathionine gamma-synthase/methionine-gamma-lyase